MRKARRSLLHQGVKIARRCIRGSSRTAAAAHVSSRHPARQGPCQIGELASSRLTSRLTAFFKSKAIILTRPESWLNLLTAHCMQELHIVATLTWPRPLNQHQRGCRYQLASLGPRAIGYARQVQGKRLDGFSGQHGSTFEVASLWRGHGASEHSRPRVTAAALALFALPHGSALIIRSTPSLHRKRKLLEPRAKQSHSQLHQDATRPKRSPLEEPTTPKASLHRGLLELWASCSRQFVSVSTGDCRSKTFST